MVAHSSALAFHYQDALLTGHPYPSTVANPWHTSSTVGHRHPRPSMKRELSDSDNEDTYDDGSGKGTPTQSTNSCQMQNRKKRRGIIEKKRRDRINNSLTELRRLVPTAFEKQGSAKLEKAEILQMTVDHLKMLHAKGFDAFSFDPHKFAMDYHSIGFRECASEVARYLVSVEGLDLQDPLRLRLMSHLQCFSTQRELASKTTPAPPTHGGGSWSTFSPVQTGSLSSSQFTPSSTATTANMPPSTQSNNLQLTGANTMDNVCNSDINRFSQEANLSPSLSHHMRLPPASTTTMNPHHHHHQSSAASPSYHVATHGHQPISHHHPFPAQYPVHLNINSGFTSMSPSPYSPNSSSTTTAAQVKPYRPWGTELAY